MKRVLNFVKKEAVLSASALLAVISAFFVRRRQATSTISMSGCCRFCSA